MTHLSPLQVKQFAVSALSEDKAAAAAVHCAECQSCHQQFVEELKWQRGGAPFTFTLEPEFWFRHDHVDFELLVEIADKTLDEETEEIINIHLKTCETCREDVRSFLAYRDDTARETDLSYSRPEFQTTHDVAAAPWWQRLQSRPAYAVAAIVLLAVAVLIGVISLDRRSDTFEANKHANPRNDESPGTSPTPDVVSSPSTGDGSAKVATLKDAGGEVTIERNGRVTGLDEVSENSRQHIARAALSEQIEPADVLQRLSSDEGGLRGNDNGGQGFRLLYPERRVVTEVRPVFRWESLPGVSSYQVYVLDANGKQVVQSEELPPTQTRWKAPTPLRRGQVFTWLVTAVVDGKKIVSPPASLPEMKFAVLSTAEAQELSQLRKSNSHLALGVFYAKAGLLNEAEGEFQSLIKLNPNAELPKKLLQSVRSIRKGN